MAIICEHGSYPSTDKRNTIRCTWWFDDEKQPKAVLQIIHDASEHILRYDAYARYMVENGFAVCGNDHLGHGRTAATKEDLGFFGIKHGFKWVTMDVHSLTEIAKSRFPDLPFFVLGCGMGSLFARYYMGLWPRDTDGIILCGTSAADKIAPMVVSSKANAAIKRDGARGVTAKLQKEYCGSFNKKIAKPETEFDWLSTNKENVRAYMEDEYCGFPLTNAAILDRYVLLKTISGKDFYQLVNNGLPLYIIGGEEDPVCEYGKGLFKTAACYISDGNMRRTKYKLYPKMRHEILNETGREEVYQDILDWLNGILEPDEYDS